MRVRCGACRSEIQIPGPGRFNCPACGAANEVRDPGMPAAGGPSGGLPPTPPPPPPPDPPSPRVACPDCSFSFIVGDIDVAACPNCGAEVEVGGGADT